MSHSHEVNSAREQAFPDPAGTADLPGRQTGQPWMADSEFERLIAERTRTLAQTVDVLHSEVRQRLAAEAHVREQSRMLDAFFMHTRTPLVILDRQFNFVRVNKAYADACRRPIDHFPGRNHFDLYPHAENKDIFHNVVQTRQAFHVAAKPFVNPDHPEWGMTWWDWSLTPLLDEAGQVEFLVFSLTDVTDRIRNEQQLRLRTGQLRALAGELTMTEQRERSRLAGILHDHLQQLLVAAKFQVATLNHNGPDETIKEVESLLSQAIATSRSLTAELSPPILHGAPLTAALEWLADTMAAKHSIHVNVMARDADIAIAKDVKVLLFEAVRELLFNVVKHAGVGAAVVRLKRARKSRLRIVVADGGRGFELTELRLATEGPDGRFGLFSIQERLTLIGGRLAIRSRPGKGSMFVLEAPLQPSVLSGAPVRDDAKRAKPRRRRKASPRNVVRVLLVDDHVVMREGLARLLAMEPDMKVVGEASDGLIGIDKARRLLPDIVLMDISMPNMGGIEATRRICSDLPGVRVIGLSMFEEAERGQAMLDAGAAGYVTKSGPADELLAIIRNVAARRPDPPARKKRSGS